MPSRTPEQKARRKLLDAANKDAISARNRAWLKANPHKTKEYNRANYLRNRAKRLAYAAAYRIKNREKILPALREYGKHHYRKNRTKYVARNAAYYRANKEKYRRYALGRYARNPIKFAEVSRARRAAVRGASKIESKKVEALIRTWKSSEYFICFYCEKKFPVGVLEVDHVIPLARGGIHTTSNICKSCPSCNSKKHAKHISGLNLHGQFLLI